MSDKNRFSSLCILLLFFVACNRQADVVPFKNAHAERPVVVLTPEAVRQVNRFCDEHKITTRWRLRIEVKELGNGKGRHLVDLDPGPVGPEDFEYQFEGISIVIARSQANKLSGSTVGYRADAEIAGFYVDNPTLPDSRE